ncbi:MAG TPA: AAA family ATPase, partial [Thermoplasmata archaeon]|nr:AAA family ATPase [Thermoplasmata archaeon]
MDDSGTNIVRGELSLSMRITQLQIDGFRSLVGIDTGLMENVLVLVGPNMAGKSNLIRFLESLSGCLQDGTADRFSGDRFDKMKPKLAFSVRFDLRPEIDLALDSVSAPKELRKGPFMRELEIRITRDFSDTPGTIQYDEEWYVSSSDDSLLPLVACRRKSNPRQVEVSLNPIDSELLKLLVGPQRTQTVRSGNLLNEFPLMHASPWASKAIGDVPILARLDALLGGYAGRWSGIHPIRPNIADSTEVRGVRRVDESGSNVVQFMDTLRRDNISAYHTVLHRLGQFLSTLDAVEISLVEGSNNLHLTYTEKHLSSTFRPSQMSDGARHLLRLLAKLFEDSSSSRLLRFEEIENHLHPGAQLALVRLLKDIVTLTEGKTQFVVTSHSEVVGAAAELGWIRILERKEGKTVMKQVSKDTFPEVLRALDLWPGIFYEADVIVYVEGEFDEDIYPILYDNGLAGWRREVQRTLRIPKLRIRFERIDGSNNVKTLTNLALWRLARV